MPKIRYEMVPPYEMGKRLMMARRRALMTRNAIAVLLSKPGGERVTAMMVRHWEEGRANLPVWAAVQLCNEYGLGITNLIRK